MKWICLRDKSRMINMDSIKEIYARGVEVWAIPFDGQHFILLTTTNEDMAKNVSRNHSQSFHQE